MSYYYYYYNRPKPKPRAVKGGIRAQSRRGDFGQSWWARAWLASLYYWDDRRIVRGKTYARKGQVLSIEVQKGAVIAYVQGSARQPYRTVLTAKPLAEQHWRGFAQALLERPAIAACMLAGRMPDGAKDAFDDPRLSSILNRLELGADCTCSDWRYNCKHAAAVCLILAEEIDRDPFLALKICGVERDDLLGMMNLCPAAPMPAQPENLSGRARRGESGNAGSPAFPAPDGPPVPHAAPPAQDEPPKGEPAEPLPPDPRRFWGRAAPDDAEPEAVEAPSEPAAPLERLGSFPLWSGVESFTARMQEIYNDASRAGMLAFLRTHKRFRAK